MHRMLHLPVLHKVIALKCREVLPRVKHLGHSLPPVDSRFHMHAMAGDHRGSTI